MVRRIKRINRNRPNRKVKNIILIATEGNNKTESIYFSAFNQLQGSYRIQMARGNKTDPKGIVEDLIRTMEKEDIDLEFGDLAICVFDTDFGEFKDKQITSAKKLADKHGITVITSNPCFEIWFIEHFGYTTKRFYSNIEVIEELKKKIPEYTKSSDLRPVLYPKTDNAITNCKKLEEYHDSIGNRLMDRNPSSEVYKIIETIKEK